MSSDEFKTALRKSKLFDVLSDADLNLLIHYGKIRFFSRGDTIYTQGEFAHDTFGVIISGRVGIIAKNGQVIKGMGPGEVLGEIGAVTQRNKRTLTVEAIKSTEMLEWKVKNIQEMVPDLVAKLRKIAWKSVTNYME